MTFHWQTYFSTWELLETLDDKKGRFQNDFVFSVSDWTVSKTIWSAWAIAVILNFLFFFPMGFGLALGLHGSG